MTADQSLSVLESTVAQLSQRQQRLQGQIDQLKGSRQRLDDSIRAAELAMAKNEGLLEQFETTLRQKRAESVQPKPPAPAAQEVDAP